MSNELELRRRRAAWRAAHRGTKELDVMIGKYAAEYLPSMDENALAHFEEFLAVSEPDLQNWLLAPSAEHSIGFADLVGQVRRFHGLDK